MRISLVALSAVAAASLAGCSSGGGAEDAVRVPLPELTEPASPSESSPAADDPERNERGNLVKVLGEEAGTTTLDGKPLLTFSVDEIIPNVQCTEDYSYGSENGNITAVHMRVSTEPGLDPDDLGYFTISAHDFKFIGSDGLTFSDVATGSTYGCLDQSVMFPSDQLSPGSKYSGVIVLDLPEDHGTIIYSPTMVDVGWEWSY